MEFQDPVIADRGRLIRSGFAVFALLGAEGRLGMLYTFRSASQANTGPRYHWLWRVMLVKRALLFQGVATGYISSNTVFCR